ncbi:MAG TPA: SusC/RagA family TonB-linked outer membrane protein, partial [Butyricimonas virosa]|nr:SusC/RagA family TonB-linked outer membrane protein [Butyricimonas virosa]
MNKFMKHQKLQFKPGSFRLNGLFRVVFLICCLLSAGLTQAQEKKITAEFKDTPLSNVLKQLEKLSTYKILFTYDDVQSYKVTVSLKDATITEALQKVLDGKPFVFSDVANGKYISVVYQPKKKSDTTKEIKGKVVDSKGETVIGATVRVVNATIGTATDIDGNFTLRVPENVMTLEIGVVGMKTQLVSIKDKTEVRVVMEEDNTVLEDVVVTGIFKKAKESYTGAVSSINAEQLKMYKGQNVLQTLKNIDASLNFTVNNAVGSNPNAVPQINIRGNSSLPISVQEYNESASNAVNTPLIIRDGFEISLEQLMDYNDDEIESINILKDAAATAIYGSRGSNGVIVVITKQPEAGKLRVNVEVGMDLEIPDLSSYDLLNAAQKLELERSLGLYDNTVAPSNDVWYKEAYYKRLRDVLSGTDTDWLSKPLHTGVGTHYNLRMEGGSEQFRWGVSAAYKDIQGAMKESSRRNFNGSVTLMYQMKKLIFRNYSSYTTNEGKESKYGNFSDYVKQQPYNAAYDQNGKLVRYFDGFHKATGKSQNPLYDATLNIFDKSGYQALTNNFSVEWKPTEELTLRGQVGISGKNTTNDAFLPAEHSTFTEDEYYSTDEGFLRRGTYTYSPGRTSSYDGNLTLAYNKVFHDK